MSVQEEGEGDVGSQEFFSEGEEEEEEEGGSVSGGKRGRREEKVRTEISVTHTHTV